MPQALAKLNRRVWLAQHVEAFQILSNLIVLLAIYAKSLRGNDRS
jgi:hypothetical protein